MKQLLEIELAIPIPSDSILVKRAEYEDMQKDSLKGRQFKLKDLSKRTGISTGELTKLFDKPRIKKMVDVEKGGFVVYPEKQGSPYLFLASKTIEFIDTHFPDLMKKGTSK